MHFKKNKPLTAVACVAAIGLLITVVIKLSSEFSYSKKIASFLNPGALSNDQAKREDAQNRENRKLRELKKKPLGLGSAIDVTIPGLAKLNIAGAKKALTENGDDFVLLGSALMLCEDPEILAKCKIAANTQPSIAAVLAFQATNPQIKLDYAELFIKNDPQNSLGYLMASEAAFQIGDKDKALSFLEKSQSVDGLNLFTNDFAAGKDRMYELSGYDVVERGLLAREDPWKKSLISLIDNIGDRVIDDVDGEIVGRNASCVLNMLDKFHEQMGDSLSLAQSKSFHSTEELILRRLPPGFRMADGSSLEYRINQVSSERLEIVRKAAEVDGMLGKTSYEMAAEYFQRISKEGEKSASAWFLGE